MNLQRQLSRFFFAFVLIALVISGCSRRSTTTKLSDEDSALILRSIASHRAEMDEFFRSDPESPFVRDTTVRFHGIQWFPPDLKFYFRSRLFRYDHPEPVTILGTKGEERKEIKYGYFLIPWEGKDYTLNVYRKADDAQDRSLSVWFTDATTGKETYGVGRYLDISNEAPDPNHLYILDFNNCYNPYCAYSHLYSCAVPRQEDHLDFAVYAGEKKYHE